MTQKELKHTILRSLYASYKEKGHVSIGIKELAAKDNLVFDSPSQLTDAVKSLKDQGFVNASFFMGGDGLISKLSPAGIDFVEENLLTTQEQVLDGLKDTDNAIRTGVTIDLEDGNNTSYKPSPEPDLSSENQFFRAKSNYRKVVDKDAKPCFGVDSLAECYAKQIEKIADSSVDAVPMIGIFGPWGRGKTYFYSRIKDYFFRKHNTKFEFIEFNAWKHRETPAIWAYLYETIYRNSSWWTKFRLWLKDKWRGSLKITSIFVLAWLLSVLLAKLPNLSERVLSLFKDLSLPIAWIGGVSVFIYGFINNPTSALSLIKKYSGRRSFTSELGIQNEVEEHLVSLLKSMVTDPTKKRIILYVDDIDRCNAIKMIDVIDSLRVILENEEIRKRLVVLCSLDKNKIMSGYIHLNQDIYSSETDGLTIMAREHMEKLFIFGIKLPELDTTQQCLFVSSIINHGKEATKSSPIEIETPYSTYRKNASIIPVSASEEEKEINDTIIEDILNEFITNYNGTLTPRKLRILYYRLLMAINIAAAGGGAMTREIAMKILDQSTKVNVKNESTDTALSDIVEMVVPF